MVIVFNEKARKNELKCVVEGVDSPVWNFTQIALAVRMHHLVWVFVHTAYCEFMRRAG